MTWNLIGEYKLTDSWTILPVTSGILFRITQFYTGRLSKDLLKGVICQYFGNPQTYFDYRSLSFKVDPEGYVFVKPTGLELRRLAVKSNSRIPGDWTVRIEEIEDLSGLNFPIPLEAVDGLTEVLADKSNTNHEHVISDINNLSESLNSKASINHIHQVADLTNLQNLLDEKALAIHGHVISDINNLSESLNSKASINHIHQVADLTNLQNLLDEKALAIHGHVISDINNLSDTLQGLYLQLDTKVDKISSLWFDLELLNGWSNFGADYVPAQYRKLTVDTVEVRGIIKKNGSFINNEAVAILPVGHRPSFKYPVSTATQNRDCRILIENTGEIRVRTGSNTETSINCVFGI